MKLTLIRWVAARLQHRLITGEDGTPYLSRYRVFGWMPGSARGWPFSVYLHHFHRPDMDQEAPHNHPWSAFSIILHGGYTEARLASRRDGSPVHHDGAVITRRLRAGQLNVIRADDFHVVRELHGECWTLFFVGRKRQTWGFSVPGRGFVAWRDRLAERGIDADY